MEFKQSPYTHITRLFTRQGDGFDIRITPEIIERLQAIKEGDFLVVFPSKSEDGDNVLNLKVKRIV